MPRYAARVDENQPAIVEALRTIGATVQPLHAVGKGVPDILVGYQGRNLLLEIKRDGKAKKTGDQLVWHDAWRGQVAVVSSVREALEAVGVRVQGVIS